MFDHSVIKQLYWDLVTIKVWDSFTRVPSSRNLTFFFFLVLSTTAYSGSCSLGPPALFPLLPSSSLRTPISNFISHWRFRRWIGGSIVGLRTRSCILGVGWAITRFPTMHNDFSLNLTLRYLVPKIRFFRCYNLFAFKMNFKTMTEYTPSCTWWNKQIKRWKGKK